MARKREPWVDDLVPEENTEGSPTEDLTDPDSEKREYEPPEDAAVIPEETDAVLQDEIEEDDEHSSKIENRKRRKKPFSGRKRRKIDEEETESGEENIEKKSGSEEESEEKKSFWKRMTVFGRISFILLVLSILMGILFTVMGRIPSVILSVMQIIGIIIALLFHKKKLKSSKKLINKGTILTLVILLMIGNAALCARKELHSRNIADQNAERQTESQVDLIEMPLSAEDCLDRVYSEVYKELKDAGFTNVDCIPVEDTDISESEKIGTVASVSINGEATMVKGDSYDKASQIIVTYHAYTTYALNLTIDFDGNFLFNKYDVDLYLNDSQISTLEHGEDYEFTLTPQTGTVVLRFEKSDDDSVSETYKFTLKSDTELELVLTCDKENITVEKK